MIYEWDEAKRLANLKKHGIDFLDADLVMESEFVWIVDSSRNSECPTFHWGWLPYFCENGIRARWRLRMTFTD